MLKNLSPIRYYVHGDLHQEEPNSYYCHQCDLFAPKSHFDEVAHISNRAQRFQESLRAWKFHAQKSKDRFFRPGKAENIIAPLAAADTAEAKAKRSSFFRWLVRQKDRDDPIGDLARDVEFDKGFPAAKPDIITLKFHLRRHDASSEALVALDEAWNEFRSKRKLRVGLTVSERFKIFRRDLYRCQICGKSAQDGCRLEVDHKIPVSKSGSNDSENLWTLCDDCNRGKSDRDL